MVTVGLGKLTKIRENTFLKGLLGRLADVRKVLRTMDWQTENTEAFVKYKQANNRPVRTHTLTGCPHARTHTHIQLCFPWSRVQIHSFRHMWTLNTHDPTDSPRCPQNPMLMDIQAHIRIPFPSAGLPPCTCMCTHIEVTEENSASSSAAHAWSTSGTASSGPRNLYPCVQAPFWGSPWLW